MVDFEYKASYDVGDFREIMRILRGEDGCPWDREQTHESISRNLLEEAYEVCEAIDEGDPAHLREELGDLLMQVLFHSQMEDEAGRFNVDDVADEACKKLIRRHPHIFSDTIVSGTEDVLQNWDEIKKRERAQKTTASAMDSVAKNLPALWRAEKIQAKARKAGFDWPDISGAMDKLEEELGEFKDAVVSGEGIEEEIGDLLFAAVNAARFAGVDPEKALNASCEKFIRRFRYIEDAAEKEGRELEEMTLDDMEFLYQKGKAGER